MKAILLTAYLALFAPGWDTADDNMPPGTWVIENACVMHNDRGACAALETIHQLICVATPNEEDCQE